MIYFVGIEQTGKVKIGFTAAEDVSNRIRQLQTGQPHKLYLLGTIDGDVEAEKGLHEIFSDLRVKGEWFEETQLFVWLLKFMCEHKLPWYFARIYFRLQTDLSAMVKEKEISNIGALNYRLGRQRIQIRELKAEIERLRGSVCMEGPSSVKAVAGFPAHP